MLLRKDMFQGFASADEPLLYFEERGTELEKFLFNTKNFVEKFCNKGSLAPPVLKFMAFLQHFARNTKQIPKYFPTFKTTFF